MYTGIRESARIGQPTTLPGGQRQFDGYMYETVRAVSVSAIIPTFNREDMLGQAIDSVLSQDYPELEIIVVDDGSTDQTAHILGRYGDRIICLRQANEGEAVARNRGIEASHGAYLAFLDSDDIWLPGKLAAQIAFLALHPSIGMVASHVTTLDASGQVIGSTPMYGYQSEGVVRLETILLRSPLAVSALVMRREALPQPRPFTPGTCFGADWEMCIRVGVENHIWFMDTTMAAVRQHAGNVTSILADRQQIEAMLTQRLDVIGRTATLWSTQVIRAADLRRRMEAREFGSAAIRCLVAGSTESAQQWLQQAIALDAATWHGGDELADLMTHCTQLLFQTSGVAGALEFLDRAFTETLLGSRRLGRFRSTVYARAHLFTLADGLWRQGDIRGARKHLLIGLQHEPSQAVNRGVLARLIRSFRRADSWYGVGG